MMSGCGEQRASGRAAGNCRVLGSEADLDTLLRCGRPPLPAYSTGPLTATDAVMCGACFSARAMAAADFVEIGMIES